MFSQQDKANPKESSQNCEIVFNLPAYWFITKYEPNIYLNYDSLNTQIYLETQNLVPQPVLRWPFILNPLKWTNCALAFNTQTWKNVFLQNY